MKERREKRQMKVEMEVEDWRWRETDPSNQEKSLLPLQTLPWGARQEATETHYPSHGIGK